MLTINFQGLAKLKSSQIVFEEAFVAGDPDTLEQLKELSSRRRFIEYIHENSNVPEAIAREMSGGLTSRCEQNIKNTEQYLPLLENFIVCTDLICDKPQVVDWISGLNMSWCSHLTSSSFFSSRSSKFYQINDLRFELAMVLFLYGALLQNWAREVLSTDLVQSTSLLRKAAGVYHHLAIEVLSSPRCKLPPAEVPPEAIATVSTVFSFICLAEAQAVTAMKAEQKGTTGGLLAKLHRGVSDFLEEALDKMQSVIKHNKDISSCFMDYIASCKTLHELESYKYMAESLKTDGRIGAAVGVLRLALKSKQKHKPKEESWRSVYNETIDHMTEMLRKYERENDFVWYEKVPEPHLLPLPESVQIVSCIAYVPQKWERNLVFEI